MKSTKADILSEFDSFLKKCGSDGMTTLEIAEAVGISQMHAGRKIKAMIRDGRAEYCGKKNVITMSGASYPVPTYRMKKK